MLARSKEKQNQIDNAFLNCIYSRDLEVIKAQFERGANINAKLEEGDSWLSGRTMLHQAVDMLFQLEDVAYNPALSANGFRILDWLLSKGADINARNSNGYTPLQHAVYQGKTIHLIKYLCAKGADTNNKCDQSYMGCIGDRHTVLRTAMSSTRLNYIACLCEYCRITPYPAPGHPHNINKHPVLKSYYWPVSLSVI